MTEPTSIRAARLRRDGEDLEIPHVVDDGWEDDPEGGQFRGLYGPLKLKVWWARGIDPQGSTKPPWAAAVLGHRLKERFETMAAAKEAAEKLADRWARELVAATGWRRE